MGEIVKITEVSGTAVPIRGNDIDTDRIIPARYLKEVTFARMGEYPFFDERFDASGRKKDHPFNDPEYRGASLLFVKWLFVPIAVAAGLLGTYELSRALRTGGRRVDVVPQLIAGTAVLLTGPFAALWLSWVVLFAAVAFVSVWRMVAQMIASDGRTYGDVLSDVVVGAFVQVYVPFLTSVALMLLSREHGEWWVLGFVAVAVAADTCIADAL